MSDMKFLSSNTKTWEHAWNAIIEKYGDSECYNASCNEVWQYMSSVRRGNQVEHQFRHRCLPATGKREYFSTYTNYNLADYI